MSTIDKKQTFSTVKTKEGYLEKENIEINYLRYFDENDWDPPIIITRESNAPLMDVMYRAGVAYNKDYMTRDEARAVKNITNIVNKINAATSPISFNEFKYFTGVKSLVYYDFKDCENLTSIEIPNSVTKIGYYCFLRCRKLTSIKIPNSVTSFGDGAFCGCSSLVSINLPKNLTSIGDSNDHSDCFAGCSSLTSIKIPNSVTSLGPTCFYNCSSLTSIKIPENITSIGDSCFYGCSSLSDIICYPYNAPKLGTKVFGNSNGNYTGRNTYNTGENTLYIHDKMITGYDQGDWANILCNPDKCGFTLSNSIETDDIPEDTIATINTNPELVAACFAAGICENPLYLTQSEAEVVNSSQLEADFSEVSPNSKFSKLKSFNEFRYFTGVDVIPQYAFAFCRDLTSIQLPPSIRQIDQYAFIHTDNLSISLDLSNVDVLGKGIFIQSAITGVTLPKYIETIPDYCFQYCKNLKSITLPTSVKIIRPRAFNGSNIEFINLENITEIYSHAFSACIRLQTIGLPNLTYLGDKAFSGCRNLERSGLTMDTPITKIPYKSHSGCNYIATDDATLCIPYTVEEIQANAFTKANINLESSDGYKIYISTKFRTKEDLTNLFNNCLASDVYIWDPDKRLFSNIYVDEYQTGGSCIGILDIFANMWRDSEHFISMNDRISSKYKGYNLWLCTDGHEPTGDNCYNLITDVKIQHKEPTQDGYGDYIILNEGDYEYVINPWYIDYSLCSYANFSWCKSISRVVLDLFVAEQSSNITDSKFRYCNGLTGAEINIRYDEGYYTQCETSDSPYPRFGIPNKMFHGCSSLQSVHIGPDVRHIGVAFSRCPSLSIITVDSANGYYTSRNYLAEESNCIRTNDDVDTMIIQGCKSTTFNFPVNCNVTIGRAAFAGSGIEELDLSNVPGSVTIDIDQAAFKNCHNLSNINFTGIDGTTIVKGIGKNAFRNCNITEIHSGPITPKYYNTNEGNGEYLDEVDFGTEGKNSDWNRMPFYFSQQFAGKVGYPPSGTLYIPQNAQGYDEQNTKNIWGFLINERISPFSISYQ